MKVKPQKPSRDASGGYKAAKSLGVSRLTGGRVLQPVAKRANVSLAQVRRAIRALNPDADD